MGPFRLADLVGGDISLHVGRNFIESFPERVYKGTLIPRMNEAKRLGEKTKGGYYDHSTRPAKVRFSSYIATDVVAYRLLVWTRYAQVVEYPRQRRLSFLSFVLSFYCSFFLLFFLATVTLHLCGSNPDTQIDINSSLTLHSGIRATPFTFTHPPPPPYPRRFVLSSLPVRPSPPTWPVPARTRSWTSSYPRNS